MVGAVGLLATIGDEFVGPDPERPVTGTATAMGAAPTEVDEGRSEGAALPAEFDGGRGDSGGGGTGKAGRRSAGHALRERLSDMAKEFFQGANKVRWDEARSPGGGGGEGHRMMGKKRWERSKRWSAVSSFNA